MTDDQDDDDPPPPPRRRAKPLCECGRPAVAVSRQGRSDGRPRAMPNHPLCYQCFHRQVDANRRPK